ncbi:hypothetical protein [Bradyrhizobium sp.]|uniref:hypothetical protein n=1 Tax=Bradyrhizobium sp. TaxID=376 RepID=UPI002630FC93|nr:hypothetical protein [Bradyrhizobium sp.]
MLSTSAMLPMITTPSIAQAASNSYTRPDLAARFEELYGKFRDMARSEADSGGNFERALFEKTGIVFRGYGQGREYPDWYEDVRKDMVHERHKEELDPDLENWSELSGAIDDLAKLILNERAVTVADLILQAKVCALANNNFWRDELSIESMDFGDQAYRLLVDRLCEFAGERALPGLEVLPMPTADAPVAVD